MNERLSKHYQRRWKNEWKILKIPRKDNLQQIVSRKNLVLFSRVDKTWSRVLSLPSRDSSVPEAHSVLLKPWRESFRFACPLPVYYSKILARSLLNSVYFQTFLSLTDYENSFQFLLKSIELKLVFLFLAQFQAKCRVCYAFTRPKFNLGNWCFYQFICPVKASLENQNC